MEVAQFILTLFMFSFLGGVLWYLKKNESHQSKASKEANELMRKYFQHMMSELKVPEPMFHVKQESTPKPTQPKPLVKRRTEEEEYNLTLPPGSTKRVI